MTALILFDVSNIVELTYSFYELQAWAYSSGWFDSLGFIARVYLADYC